jgi:hypothetical protein
MRGVMSSKVSSSELCTILKVMLTGACLGFMSSLMVNSALVEVSLSPFFAVSFGLLFLVTAVTVWWQLRQEVNARNWVLLALMVLLNAASGLVCFILERDWSRGLSASQKVPLYGLLGLCLSFSVNFSVLDLLVRFELSASSTLLVRTEWQVRVIAITSAVTGIMYGLTFGVLDIEDQILRSCAPRSPETRVFSRAPSAYPTKPCSPSFAQRLERTLTRTLCLRLARSPFLFREALHREARVCYPIGIASGAFAALMARILEVRAEAMDPDLGYARGHSGLRHDSL